MIQNLLLKDQLNLRRKGLEYALKKIHDDYVCRKCRKHHRRIVEVNNCCKGGL